MWLSSKKTGTFDNCPHLLSTSQSWQYFRIILITWTFSRRTAFTDHTRKTTFLIFKYTSILTFHIYRFEDISLTDCWFLPLKTLEIKLFPRFELLFKSHFAKTCRAKRGLQTAAGENLTGILKKFSHFAMWIFEHCDVVFLVYFAFCDQYYVLPQQIAMLRSKSMFYITI